MSIKKLDSIKASERVFDFLDEKIRYINEGWFNGDRLRTCDLDGYLSTFNNCREQGFYLTLMDINFKDPKTVRSELYVWVFEHRNSDDIVVIVDSERPTFNGMFSESSWKKEKLFRYNQEREASDYIATEIIKFFNLSIGEVE